MVEVKKYIPNRYILSYHARRKNYRRKIAKRCKTETECLRYWMQHYDYKYDYEIYTYDWKLIRKLDINELNEYIEKWRKENEGKI